MNVTVTDISDTRKDLVVTITGEEVAREEALVLKEFTKQAKVPGFRPGKAPVALLRQRFKQSIQEELNRVVSQKLFSYALSESKLEVYSIVNFGQNQDFAAGQEANVDLSVDVYPKFDLPSYKGLETQVPAVVVSDAEVDSALESIRAQRAQYAVVERAAAKGDYVRVSYKGTVDGQEIALLVAEQPSLRLWGSMENTWELAGAEGEAAQYLVPAVSNGVIGLAPNQSGSATHTFPEDFAVEALRGKQATYEFSVAEVRERALPELNEEFFKAIKVENLGELKAQILDDIEGRKKAENDRMRRQQILDILAAAVDFSLPESAVENETQAVMGRIMSDNHRRGVPQEEFEKNKEELHKQAGEVAQRDVKLQVILMRIAREEKIEVQDQDLNRAIWTLAQQYRQKPEDIVKDLRKNRQRLQTLQQQILFAKTLDFLLTQSKVVETPAQIS